MIIAVEAVKSNKAKRIKKTPVQLPLRPIFADFGYPNNQSL